MGFDSEARAVGLGKKEILRRFPPLDDGQPRFE